MEYLRSGCVDMVLKDLRGIPEMEAMDLPGRTAGDGTCILARSSCYHSKNKIMLPFRSVLVLCEGNHCRSPLAAGLLRRALGDRVRVSSAGFCALEGVPAEPEIRRLALEADCSLEEHRGRNLTPSLALGSDLILVMDKAQLQACIQSIPAVRGRVYLLGQWLDMDRQEIPDPFRQGPEAMATTFHHIQEAVATWLPRLLIK